MFIYNFKLDGKRMSKVLLGLLFTTIFIITSYICYSLYTNKSFRTIDNVQSQDVYELTASDYTNVLKNVHDNLNEYIGQKIRFTGYIYRLYDFADTQFVLARNMVISSDFKTVVVGFLCTYENAKDYVDGTWVQVEGELEKGDYHGEIPVIKVESIQKVDKPSEEFVYPPDNAFVATSTIL